MRNFNSSVLGDWIQIAASVGIIVGIFLLIIDLALTQQLFKPQQTNQAFSSTVETQRLYPRENLAEITKERQSELRYFVEKNCPACHGTRMTGSIGPALSKADLQYLSVNAVTFTILYGRPAKGMPPWDGQLSEKDAYWIAQLLKGDGIIE